MIMTWGIFILLSLLDEVQRGEGSPTALSKNTSDEWKVFTIPWLAIPGVVIVIFFAVISIFRTKPKDARNPPKPSDARNPPKPSDILMKALKESYKEKFFANGQKEYVNCEYVITITKEDTPSAKGVDDLLKKLPENRHVIFVGKSGIGKSSLCRNILWKWINEEKNDIILIYIQLKYASEDTCILEELINLSKGKISSTQELTVILQNKKSIVLLDGLSSISVFCPLQPNTTNTGVNITGLKVHTLLDGSKTLFKLMNTWVTTREMPENNNEFIRVNLNGLSTKQIDDIYTKFYPAKDQDASQGLKDLKTNLHFAKKPLMIHLLNLILSVTDNTERENKFKYLSAFGSNEIGAAVNLIKHSYWDLLACLLEAITENNDKHSAVVKLFHMENMVFNENSCDYHREAVLNLLKICNELKIKPMSLKFCWSYTAVLAVTLQYLPKVHTYMTFVNAQLSTPGDFMNFIKICLQKANEIQFLDSEVPTSIKELDISENQNVSHKKEGIQYNLKFYKGKWKWKEE